MTNPNRGRGGTHVNGHGNVNGPQPNGTTRRPAPTSNTDDQDSDGARWSGYRQEDRRPPVPQRGLRGRGFAHRGGHRGGFRGRGAAPALVS